MKRKRVSWSPFVDRIEGPCVACGGAITNLLPGDRPNPALLYHAGCDPMPALRERLKTATPPLLPPDQTTRGQKK